jgi:rod shape-determining protein MreD
VALIYTSRDEIEVHRFSLPVAVGIPLTAIFLQVYLLFQFGFFSGFDLPLLITIFFAVARRNQLVGLLTGSAIGLVQDSLTHQPIGLYGIAKTVVGYTASSLGVKIDVENPGSRLLMTMGFYLLHEVVYFVIARGLVGRAMQWRWGYQLGAAIANALLAVVLFALLDRFKQRA